METFDAVESAVLELKGTKWRARLIQANIKGSSGFYPEETLRRDGPKVFTKGTPIFFDHQTPSERRERPFGSVTDFVGELAEDAYFDGDGLYADIEVFEDVAPAIKARAKKIGLSIRAQARKDSTGTVTELLAARSVDFVMRPGAGGKLVEALESATEIGSTEESVDSLEEGNTENMEKELEAINVGLGRLTEVLESLSIKVDALTPVEESGDAVDADAARKALVEEAATLAASGLSAEGIARVADLRAATGRDLGELIAEEQKYIEEALASAGKDADVEGSVEESEEDTEVEESASDAKITIPTISVWTK